MFYNDQHSPYSSEIKERVLRLLLESEKGDSGVGKSWLFRDEQFNSINYEVIKSTTIKKREIRLIVTTDVACEWLHLNKFNPTLFANRYLLYLPNHGHLTNSTQRPENT
ncbi:hypothetical protein ACX1NX_10995 [Acinetobacter sp. ANC 5383]